MKIFQVGVEHLQKHLVKKATHGVCLIKHITNEILIWDVVWSVVALSPASSRSHPNVQKTASSLSHYFCLNTLLKYFSHSDLHHHIIIFNKWARGA